MMKALIVEDEIPASRKLIRLIGETDSNIEIIGVVKSVEQTINWFQSNPKPDLIFMDIQLEDGVCFEIFENIKLQTPIIFTTAYDEYTLKAFKVNSIDYLLKPVGLKELKNAVYKFKNFYIQNYDLTKIESILQGFQPVAKERFLIKIGEHFKSVSTFHIHCFYIKERFNFFLAETGKSYPVDYSLDKIEKMVDSNQFFRINRNFIIRFSAIKDIVAYSSNRLKIKLESWHEKDDIIVSRDRVPKFKEWMDR